MSELVTGEAVVLELRLAKLASRALAIMLDLIVLFVALVIGTLVISAAAGQLDEAAGAAVGLVFIIGLLVGVPVLVETLTGGRSIGKLALGLRVVRDDGGPIRFRHALVRGLLGFVEFYLTVGTAALVTSLASPSGKRLGDLLAGTVVVRERMPVHQAPPATMPRGLESWAATLDLAHLSDATALQARGLLSRWHQLAPAQRDSMSAELASAVAATVTPYPPPGVPPHAYLSAVLAERHRRALIRLGVPMAPPGYPGGYPGQVANPGLPYPGMAHPGAMPTGQAPPGYAPPSAPGTYPGQAPAATPSPAPPEHERTRPGPFTLPG